MSKKPLIYFLKLISSVFLLSSFLIADALAVPERTGAYASLMYLGANEKVDSFDENRGSTAIRIGKVMNDSYSLEAHGSVVNSSDTDDGIFTVGGFARIEKAEEKYTYYGLLGVSTIRSYSTSLDDITETSLSYGFGIDVYGSPNLAITLEYVHMIDAELDSGQDLTYQSFGIGLSYRFVEDKNNFNKSRFGFGLFRD